jgi:hypothetical protein
LDACQGDDRKKKKKKKKKDKKDKKEDKKSRKAKDEAIEAWKKMARHCFLSPWFPYAPFVFLCSLAAP